MVSDAQTGAFKYIIVYMFDRFARNRRDSVMYKEMLKEKYGIKVISALEPISEDEGGEFYEMFLEWNAEKYSKRLSKRIRDGIDTSIANGMFCGGKVPFGYRLEIEQTADNAKPIKKVVIYDEEAEIIRFIFTQYADGKTKKEIADILNEKGYRINGKRFKGRSFDNWMTNEKYTGEFKFGGRDCKNIYPAIVDKALFLKVQEKLAENKYVLGGQETAKAPYLLSGKVFCGHCGSEMVADKSTGKSGKKYSYYTCKKSQKHECDKLRENKDNLESYVTSCVVNFLKDKKNAEMAVDDVFAYYEKRTDEDNLRSIAARIANIQNEAEKLADAFIDAKSQLLKNKIETKMAEYEILLNDLETQPSTRIKTHRINAKVNINTPAEIRIFAARLLLDYNTRFLLFSGLFFRLHNHFIQLPAEGDMPFCRTPVFEKSRLHALFFQQFHCLFPARVALVQLHRPIIRKSVRKRFVAD